MLNTVPIKYAYDPESAESRFMRKYVFGQWRSATEIFGIAVMLLFLFFIVKIAMREYGAFFLELHPSLLDIAPLVFWAGIVLGLTAAYLCSLLVNRLHSTIIDVEREAETYNKGPIDVVLDADGVHTTSKHSAQFVAWPSVSKVVKTPQGVGLRLDGSNFIPVIDEELPEGTTRDDLLSAIETWRAKAGT